MKSWKTTVGGLILAIGGYLTQQEDSTLKLIGGICVVLGPLILGTFSKDNNVHGGTTAQATPPVVQAETVEEGIALECKQDTAKCKEGQS